MEKSFLAALPPELRQRVYQHLFPKDQVYHIIQHRRSKFRDFDAVLEGTEKNFPLEFNYSVCSSSTVLGGDSCRCGSSAFKTTPESFATFRRAAFKVLLTCRQLYCECWEIAYGNSIFAFNGICIESITNVMAFLRSIGPRSLSRVRHLQVEMQVRKPGPGTAHETMHSMDPDAVVVVAREFEHLLLQSQVRDLLLRVHLWNESPRHAIAWHFVRAIAELNLTTHFIKNLDITFETPQTTSFTVPYWPTHELQGWNCPSPATYYQDRRIST